MEINSGKAIGYITASIIAYVLWLLIYQLSNEFKGKNSDRVFFASGAAWGLAFVIGVSPEVEVISELVKYTPIFGPETASFASEVVLLASLLNLGFSIVTIAERAGWVGFFGFLSSILGGAAMLVDVRISMIFLLLGAAIEEGIPASSRFGRRSL
ncbi:hypothetical protein [Haloferax sp. DFSO60]|uniref:hypothetical protein n=1 Tax=Haloferax sp. DFSO60 TaxID=3388652 RepID=UPI00397A17EE